jgi:hypothetical protein
MWSVKTDVIPVIIRATGTISKSFRKYLSNVPGIHEIKELQKTAILGTAHTLLKVLKQKYIRFNIANSCNTLLPRNRGCFRYVRVNALHTGDDGGGDGDDICARLCVEFNESQ